MNRLAARISPEVVAGVFSVLVVLAVVGVRLPGGTVAGPAATGSPEASIRATASDPLAPVVRSALETIVVVNGRLAASGRELEQELDRRPPRAPEIAVALPLITAQITGVAQAVTVLVADPATASLGADLTTTYAALAKTIRAAQRESVQNAPAYVEAGKTVADLIREELAPLTARARAILAGTLQSPRPSASPAATPSPSAAASGSAQPTPTPTRALPSPSAVESGLVTNGGFENGATPWLLEVVTPAVATLAIDPSVPGAGAAAARVDIAAGTDARSGISLVQTGIGLRAGQTYTVRLLVKATEARDVRIRLAAANGDTYIARILPVGTTWIPISFTFDVLVDDSAAVLGIDLGRSTATTWIDGVAVTPGG